MTRLVTLSPSVPASGLSLTENVIDSVGGSIGWAVSGSTSSRLQRVSATLNFSRPATATMSPAIGLLDRRALDAAKGEDSRHPALLDRVPVAVEHLGGRVGPDRAGEHAPRDDAPEIGIGLEQSAEHAEAAGADLRRLDMLQHEVEERAHVLLRALGRGGHPALLGRAVENRKVELLVGGVERGDEIEDLVDDLARPRVGLVDLVDADDRLEADLERLADHELGLRHRPFGGVDEHDRAVDHRQDALDLAAEIGMARRVDDVDAHVLPHDRGRLGENGDAALALEVARIHHPLGDALVLAERARLLEQPVDERRLAMVDVGDDGDVAKLHGRERAFLTADGRMAQSAPRCPLDAKMTGITTARRVSSRSPVRLCAAIHETAAEGKGGGLRRGCGSSRGDRGAITRPASATVPRMCLPKFGAQSDRAKRLSDDRLRM